MDSADRIEQALSGQGSQIGVHEQLIKALYECNQNLTYQVSELSHQISSLAAASSPRVAPAAPVPDSRITDPEPFGGELDKCRGFLLQCSLVFKQRPQAFSVDSAKINYVIGLLRGRALAWAEAANSSSPMSDSSYQQFETKFRAVFDHPNYSGNASSRLLNLRQGSRSVADYSVEFWTLAADAKWNDEALQGVFSNGLNEHLKDELATRDRPDDLNALVSLAIALDNRLRERRKERASRSQPSCSLSASSSASHYPRPAGHNTETHSKSVPTARPAEEPMQLGRTSLTPEEKLRRIRAGECIYCGKKGHYISHCPVRPKEQAHQ